MTTFSDYLSASAYNQARDNFTGQFENQPLAQNVGDYKLYYDLNKYGVIQLNIGYGYNIPGNVIPNPRD